MSHLKNSQLRSDLGDLLKASYLPQKEAAEKLKHKGYSYDHNLSSMDTKVFVKDGKPIVVHRGTKRLSDWVDDGLIAVGLGKHSQRYKEAQKITKKVENKYGKSADSVGHSLGGWLAENSNAKGDIISYNKAVGLGDIGKKKNSNRQLDVITKGDLVSALNQTQTSRKDVIRNKKKSSNPITNLLNAHKTDNLFNEPDRSSVLFPKDNEETDIDKDLLTSPIV